MTDTELIAQQARRLAQADVVIRDYRQCVENIKRELICVGGPLNDNKLGYTDAQLVTFARILEHAEDPYDPERKR